MGNRHDDRSSRRGTRNDEPGRAFDRNQDMGGSRWSGASGRGGYSGAGERNEGYGEYRREGGYGGDPRYARFAGSGPSNE